MRIKMAFRPGMMEDTNIAMTIIPSLLTLPENLPMEMFSTEYQDIFRWFGHFVVLKLFGDNVTICFCNLILSYSI